MYIQNVPVCTSNIPAFGNTCAWCRYTRGRFECAHGERFERTHGEGCVCGEGEREGGEVSVTKEHQHQHTYTHQQQTQRSTNKRSTHNTEHARWHRQFCLPKFAQVCLSLDPRGSPKKPLDLIHYQFENRSRTTCPRFLQSFALPDTAVQFQQP